jgi:hypothetical protein
VSVRDCEATTCILTETGSPWPVTQDDRASDNHVSVIFNFFDELRRIAPARSERAFAASPLWSRPMTLRPRRLAVILVWWTSRSGRPR